MPLNAASHAEDVAVRAGKPNPPAYGRKGKRRRGWKGFYGSVHDIVGEQSTHWRSSDGRSPTVQLPLRGNLPYHLSGFHY